MWRLWPFGGAPQQPAATPDDNNSTPPAVTSAAAAAAAAAASPAMTSSAAGRPVTRLVRAATVSGGTASSPSDRSFTVTSVAAAAELATAAAPAATLSPVLASAAAGASSADVSPMPSPGVERLRSLHQRTVSIVASESSDTSCSVAGSGTGSAAAAPLQRKRTVVERIEVLERTLLDYGKEIDRRQTIIVHKREELSHLKPNVNVVWHRPEVLQEPFELVDLQTTHASAVSPEEAEAKLAPHLRRYKGRQAALIAVLQAQKAEIAQLDQELRGLRIRLRAYDAMVSNGAAIHEYTQRVDTHRHTRLTTM